VKVMSENIIETRNIKVVFSVRKGLLKRIKFAAVDNVSISIPKGSIVGLLGESGSGKTTLGKVTLALLKPTSGEVLFQGKNVFNMSKDEFKYYRLNAQYIPQDPYASIHPFKTVKDVLTDIVMYHQLAKSNREALEMAKDVMSKAGLNPPERFLNRYPFQLSGGERQRLSIARALILKPAYIVADEPVTMLDASLKSSTIKTLRDMVNAIGSSLLFITHEITLLQFFGIKTRIGVMYLGKIVEEGYIRDVLENPMHPYTQALIAAIPIADPKARETRRLILKSTIPSPLNRPHGCVLSDRCPYAMDICRKEEPILKEVKAYHKIACHLYN